MITKEVFTNFLSGNFTEAESLSTKYANNRGFPISMINGYLTYSGAESICYDMTLPTALSATLCQVRQGNISEAAPDALEKLRRCLLIDNRNSLTQHGYYKMIAGLSLSKQINELSLTYAEQPVNYDTQLKTEEYVRASYESLGYRCVHDEGSLLNALVDCILRPDTALLKTLVNPEAWYRPDNPHYDAVVPFLKNFETIAPNGRRFVSSLRKVALLEIIQKADEARIITGHALHVKLFANISHFLGHKYDVDLLLDLFTCIGVKRLHALLSFFLDHPDCAHGLPDLIAFKENEIVMIEVKRNDKLMFHQARTLHTLMALPREIISDVRIVKIMSKDKLLPSIAA